MAELLYISRRQLCRWVRDFNEGGIEGLMFPRHRRPGRKRKMHGVDFDGTIRPIIDRLTEGGQRSSSVAELRRVLRDEKVIAVGHKTLAHYLRAKGVVLRQQKPDPRVVRQFPWLFSNHAAQAGNLHPSKPQSAAPTGSNDY